MCDPNVAGKEKYSGVQSNNDIVKKLLVRSSEKTPSNLLSNIAASDQNITSNECEQKNSASNEICEIEHKFSEPQLCSSVKLKNEMQKLEILHRERKIQTKSSTSIISKASRKINIPFDEEIYKDLINLKVNDEDVGVPRGLPMRSRDVNKSKDPEPILSDFYKPCFSKEYVIKNVPPSRSIEKVWTYNGFAISEMLKKWEPNSL